MKAAKINCPIKTSCLKIIVGVNLESTDKFLSILYVQLKIACCNYCVPL